MNFCGVFGMLLMRKMLVAFSQLPDAAKMLCLWFSSDVYGCLGHEVLFFQCVDAVGIFASRINAVNLPLSAACGAY